MSPEEANYRPAVNPQAEACATCQHMGPDGMCAQLGIPVTPEMLCDLYMMKGETMTPAGRSTLEDQMLGGAGGPVY